MAVDVQLVMVVVLVVGTVVKLLAVLGGSVVVVGGGRAAVAPAVGASSLAERAEEHLGVPRVERHGDLPPETAQQL